MDSSQSKGDKPIPKFGSFKPPAAPCAPPKEQGRRDKHGRHDRHSKSRHRRRHSRSRSPSHSSDNLRRRSPVPRHRPSSDVSFPQAHTQTNNRLSRVHHERSQLQLGHNLSSKPSPPAATITDTPMEDYGNRENSSNDFYFIDSRGDPFNLTYGSTHRYAVPRYRRFGNGFVLGDEESLRIDRALSTDTTLVLRGRSDVPYNSRVRPISDIPIMGPPRFRLRESAYNVLDLAKDFVSLGSNSGAVDNDDWGEPPPLNFNRPRLIPPEYLIDPAPEEEIDWTSIRVDVDKERQNQHAELARAVQINPQDVGLWLKLIDYQDVLILGPDDENTRTLNANEQLSLADVKLSLFDKALATLEAHNKHKYRLLIGRLQTGAQLWDSHKLLQEWKKALEENPENLNLWVRYLNYRQANSPEFSIRECLTLFAEALLLNLSVTAEGPVRDQIHVYIFLRMTLLLRESGYMEMSIGLWQAVMEFCFFQPSILRQASDDQVLEAFRIFWDSEVPRIGEAGARGWREAVDSVQERNDPKTTSFATHVNGSSLIPSWAEAERDRMSNSPLPSRSLDSTMPYVSDPFRVLLFTDIRDLLRPFHHLTTTNTVIEGFMHFWQLPHIPTVGNYNNTRLWDWDTFLKNDNINLADDQYMLYLWIPPKDYDNEHTPPSPLYCPISHFVHNTSTFFTSPNIWFNSFRSWSNYNEIHVQSRFKVREYVKETLRALVDNMPDDESLTEYYLAFEFACDSTAARRAAKRIVKKKAWSLKLWNACALIEHECKQYDMARRMWAATLSADYSDASLKIHSIILWNSWVWSELEHGNIPQGLYLLHAIPHGRLDLADLPQGWSTEPFFSTTTVLQTINYLREWQDRALTYGSYQAYVAYTDCLALAYYTSEWPFKTSIDVYLEACQKIAQLPERMKSFKGLITEMIHQSRAHLLLGHIYRGIKEKGFSPRDFRGWLKDSLSQFPHNSIFLSIFMWNESRILLTDRIRDSYDTMKSGAETKYRLDDDVSLTPQNVPISNYLFIIYHEFCRASFGGTPHSARAAFEKALGQSNIPNPFAVEGARSSVTVWKLYILYELYRARNVNTAKAVFFRAIQACPWSKELMMLGFEHLRHGLPGVPISPNSRGLMDDELTQVFHLMKDRQLRVHIDILPELLRQLEQTYNEPVDQGDLTDYVDTDMEESL